MCLLLDAMAQNYKGKETKGVGVDADGYSQPKNPARQMRSCVGHTCNGVCPLSVVVRQHGTAKPAICRECGRKFTVPPGAEKLFKKADVPVNTELTKLRKQMAEMQKKLDSSAAEPASKSNEEPPKAIVTGLQAALDSAKEAGVSEIIIKQMQKDVDAAKQIEAASRSGCPLKAMWGKNTAAKSKLDQLAAQVVKDIERLENTQKRAWEAACTLSKLEEQKKRLLVQQGHITEPPEGKGAALLSAVPPANLSEEQKVLWQAKVDKFNTELQESLVKDFPSCQPMESEAVKAGDEGDEPSSVLGEQGNVKKQKAGEGTAVSTQSSEAVDAGAAAALARAVQDKQIEADALFKRTREEANSDGATGRNESVERPQSTSLDGGGLDGGGIEARGQQLLGAAMEEAKANAKQ